MTDPEALSTARRRAIDANRRAWGLLENERRSAAETAAMLDAAHESLAAWTVAGGAVEAQRGHWMIARTSLAAGDTFVALEHARRTLALTETHRSALADFDLAFAEEIAARAFAAAGDSAAALEHYRRAVALGEAIADDGDHAEFVRQLARGPWFGLLEETPP